MSVWRCHRVTGVEAVITRRQIGRLVRDKSKCRVRLRARSMSTASSLSLSHCQFYTFIIIIVRRTASRLSVCHDGVWVCLTNDINAHNNYKQHATNARALAVVSSRAMVNLPNYSAPELVIGSSYTASRHLVP